MMCQSVTVPVLGELFWWGNRKLRAEPPSQPQFGFILALTLRLDKRKKKKSGKNNIKKFCFSCVAGQVLVFVGRLHQEPGALFDG